MSKKLSEKIYLESKATLLCAVGSLVAGEKVTVGRNYNGSEYTVYVSSMEMNWLSLAEVLKKTSVKIKSVEKGRLKEIPRGGGWVFDGLFPSPDGKKIVRRKIKIGNIDIVGGVGWIDMFEKPIFSFKDCFDMRKKAVEKLAEFFAQNSATEVVKLFLLTDARDDGNEGTIIKVVEDMPDSHNFRHHGAIG